jgi:hypothetical protein
MWVAPALTSGLGNRLFQLAAAAGVAEEWNYELVLTLAACKESPHGALASIFRMFPWIRLIEDISGSIGYEEPARGFYEYSSIWPPQGLNCIIKGFRQNPKYFPKRMLVPNWDSALGGPLLRKKVEQLAGLESMAERKRTYAIHVRLGDYRILPHHQVDLARYYETALKRLPAGARLHVFSDEPNACRSVFASREMTMAVTASDVESLYEMSLCLGGTITANSTFSWWGAWFAHEAGAAWATYPSSMGNGLPDSKGIVPSWGVTLSV